jgi:hypothetical protein
MDITNGSPKRRRIGIERFLAGDTITFHGVSFWKDGNECLVVTAYSDFHTLEQISPQEAERKIARSKAVLAELAELSPDFSRVAATLPKEYEFCCDYGTGAFMLARLDGERLVWVGPEK